MGIFGGPDIVRDSLIIYYDVDNTDSYPGMPTTNLLSTAKQYEAPSFFAYRGTGYTYWTNYTTWSALGIADLDYVNFSGELKVDTLRYNNRPQANINTPYIWVASTTDSWVRSTNGSTGSTDWVTFDIQLQQRFDADKASGANTGNGDPLYCRFGLYHMPSTYDDGISFCRNLQIEEGTIRSQFTSGTRSTTNGIMDLSGNSNHANLTNAGYITGGLINYNGPGGGNYYIQPSWGSGLNPTTISYSLCFWVKSASSAEALMFASVGTAASSKRTYFGHTGGYWGWGINASGWAATGTAADQNWHYMAMVFDSSVNTAYWYMDGEQMYTKGYASYTFEFNLVTGKYSTTNHTYDWDGYVDVVMVYANKALTLAEVKQNFNAVKGRYGL